MHAFGDENQEPEVQGQQQPRQEQQQQQQRKKRGGGKKRTADDQLQGEQLHAHGLML